MDQLKMARDNKPAEARELPEGFYFAGFGDGDWKSWCECCIDAQLGVAEVSRAEFERIMLSDGKVKPENIYFLRSPEGQAVGTVTYQYGDAPGEGYIHMVGIVKGFRGMGLSTPMIQYAVGKMLNGGVRVMYLTTDDWRLPAIKTYLNCGFEPVIREKDAEMAQRWKNIMDRLGKGFSIDPAAGYFQNAGVDVMAYDDFYPEGHQSGVSVIMHGSRVASNGDVRIDRTPGQWQPVPKQIGREIDEKANTITVSMTYPGIAEAGLDYKVTVKGEGESVVVTVDFDRPVPESMAGGLFFNFELFPGALLGKPWIMDDKQGIFPRQPNGPVAETGAERQDGWLGEPYAIGKRFTVRPDDPYRRLTIETKGAPLKVYDGRMEHNNGWFVVSCDIPAGAAKNAVQWVITPNAVKDWVYAPVVQASQVGYHPAQAKTVVVELDRRDDKRGQLAVYKLGESGFREISSVAGREWGRFLRYQYLQFDLSGIREEGLYKVQYGASESSVFRVARDVYDRGVWQPVLEYFLPVQMCHMRVNEKYRVWHGLCHMDDARMAPVNQRHFDGYAQGPSTLTKYGPGDEVPGLNIGGWHDAGDDDLQISSQSGEVYALTLTYETFGVVYYDSTTIDQAARVVEIHRPDGKNDILQQIEHGVLSVVGAYWALGRLYRGIIVNDLRQYVLLGDIAAQTDGVRNGDDRWVFTEDNPGSELTAAARLAAASRALKGFNDELSGQALEAAREIYRATDGSGPARASKIHAAAELFLTTGEAEYKEFLLAESEFIVNEIDHLGWFIGRADKAMGDAGFSAAIRGALPALKERLARRNAETPYGVPYRPYIWGAGWEIQRQAFQYYFLHAAYPDIFGPEMIYNAVNFVLGCHPGSNNASFASGIGAKSATVAYGLNRADWSYIPGGVISGTALIRPDLPELLEFPYLWQQTEYVLGGGSSHYMFLVLAAREMCRKLEENERGN